MTIQLTKRAEKNYRSILTYLDNEFGYFVKEAFIERFKDFTLILKEYHQIGTLELPEKQIFGFQISKQTRVFYRLKNDKIVILSLFDVRQDINKRRF